MVREKGIIGAVCRQYLLWWTRQDKWVRCGHLDCCSQVSLFPWGLSAAPPPPLSRGTIKGVSHLSGSRSRKERKGRSRRLGMIRVAK